MKKEWVLKILEKRLGKKAKVIDDISSLPHY
jgi:hypothetical protein